MPVEQDKNNWECVDSSRFFFDRAVVTTKIRAIVTKPLLFRYDSHVTTKMSKQNRDELTRSQTILPVIAIMSRNGSIQKNTKKKKIKYLMSTLHNSSSVANLSMDVT